MLTAKRIAALTLFTAVLVSTVQAAPIPDSVLKAFDQAGSGGKVRIVVQMKEAEKVVFGAAMSLGDKASRSARMKSMRASATKSQKSILGVVQPFSVMNSAVGAKVRSFWLANAVALDVDRATLEKLAARADVKSLSLNETIPAPKITPSTAKEVPGEYTWGLTRIHIPELRAIYRLTGSGVRVGHLDSGVTGNHPDLQGKLALFKDFSIKAGQEPYDDGGHGTHTAGTLVGGNASGKWIGVAPDAKLISGKIFGESGATLEGILGAMEWVVDPDGNPDTDDGAQLVSNSWGSDNPQNATFWDAVKKWVDLGVVPVFACGNNGPNTVGTPAGFPHSFAVGSIDPDDKCSDFSSRGPVTWSGTELIKPDIAAPGNGILSSWHIGNGYTAIQGTSMACPHVGGVVTLMLQANPKLTIDRVRQILESTADDRGDAGKDNLFGSGVMNAWKAIAQVVASGVIAGSIRSHDGQAVRGEVFLPDFGVSIPTDDQGAFSFPVPVGTYKLAARAFGHKEQVLTVKAAPGTPTDLAVTLSKAADGKLTGKVVNKDGRPLAATVTFAGTGLPPVQSAAETGLFEASVPQGQYTMVVRSLGYEPRVMRELMVAAQSGNLEIVLEHLPGILIVDDDGYDHLESFFTASLDRLGRKYSVWSQQEAGPVPADVLIQYPVVIWQTGFDYQTAFTPPEQDAAGKYLASGGHMFLSGQLVGVNLRANPFFAQVFHAKYIAALKRSQGPIPAILGVEGDPVSAGLTLAVNDEGSQSNQDYPNVLAPTDPKAVAFLKYQNEERGAAGLRVEDGAAKLLYTGFGLEGVGSQASRDEFLKRSLEYLTPRAEDAVARIVAVDSTRTNLLAKRSAEANAYFEYENLLVKQAVGLLSQSPDGAAVLSRHLSAGHAPDALKSLRRAVQGDEVTR